MQKKLEVSIHLIQPIIATQPGAGEENSAVSYDYIPGSLLRGAVIGQFLGEKSNDMGSEDAKQLFFKGSVRYLNGYIVHHNTKTRMNPSLKSWRKPKKKETEKIIYDFAVKENDITQPKPLRNKLRFFSVENKDQTGTILNFADVKKQLSVHNTSEDRITTQKGVSQVFRYESIAEGQTFIAYIVGEEKYLKSVQTLINDKTLVLGRSRSAGYGQVKITCYLKDVAPPLKIIEKKPIYVRLQSDLILKTADGAFASNLSYFFKEKTKLEPDKSYKQTTSVGGFNRKWGLPLPQSKAIEAGSVFVFSNPNNSLIDLLEDLKKSGLGERVVEGLGEVAYTQEGFEKILYNEQGDERLCQKELSKQVSKDMAKSMVKRILVSRLNDILIEQVGKITISHMSETTQLSKIRSVAMIAIEQKDLSHIINYLDNLKKNSENKLRNTRVEYQKIGATVIEGRLYNWLAKLKTNKYYFWDQYFETIINKKCPKIGQFQVKSDDELKAVYSAKLIDAIMQKASKA